MCIKVPKGQILWVTKFIEGKEKYIITSNLDRSVYFLYSVDEKTSELMKVGKNKIPIFKEAD